MELDPLGALTRSFGCARLMPRFHDRIAEPEGSYWLLCDEVRTMDLSQAGGTVNAAVTGTTVQHVGPAIAEKRDRFLEPRGTRSPGGTMVRQVRLLSGLMLPFGAETYHAACLAFDSVNKAICISDPFERNAPVAADPVEAVLEQAAGQEPVDDLGDDRAPVALGRGKAFVPDETQFPKPAVQEAIARRCPGPAGAVDPHSPASSLGVSGGGPSQVVKDTCC